jgi:glutaredoxin
MSGRVEVNGADARGTVPLGKDGRGPRAEGRPSVAGPFDADLYSSVNMVLLLYTRRGCHLCEAAEDMVAAHAQAAAVEIIDVDADPDLQRLYGLRVPVLAADGAVVMEGRFDEPELARLLKSAGSSRR